MKIKLPRKFPRVRYLNYSLLWYSACVEESIFWFLLIYTGEFVSSSWHVPVSELACHIHVLLCVPCVHMVTVFVQNSMCNVTRSFVRWRPCVWIWHLDLGIAETAIFELLPHCYPVRVCSAWLCIHLCYSVCMHIFYMYMYVNKKTGCFVPYHLKISIWKLLPSFRV